MCRREEGRRNSPLGNRSCLSDLYSHPALKEKGFSPAYLFHPNFLHPSFVRQNARRRRRIHPTSNFFHPARMFEVESLSPKSQEEEGRHKHKGTTTNTHEADFLTHSRWSLKGTHSSSTNSRRKHIRTTYSQFSRASCYFLCRQHHSLPIF